jgi:uncharacterized iron-regulated membrane protein
MKATPLVRRLHRWTGLLAGAVIAVVSLSGAVLVYAPEIDRAVNRHLWEVADGPEARLSPSAVLELVRNRHPGRRLRVLDSFSDPGKPMIVQAGRDFQVFVHPRSGEVLGERAPSRTLLGRIEGLHRNLLAGAIGHTIVAVSTILLVAVIMLGWWLWWPTTPARLKSSFVLHFGRGWKRANYDLHNVLGFYASLVLLLLALTGVVLAYPSVGRALRQMVGDVPASSPAPGVTSPAADPAGPATAATGVATRQGDASDDLTPVDVAVERAIREFPDAIGTTVRFPPPAGGPLRVIRTVGIAPPVTDVLLVDTGSDEVLDIIRHSDAGRGPVLGRLVGIIHLGTVFGEPSKLIAFLVCLVATTLPVTGAVVWFPRWRRRRRRKRQAHGA